MLYLQDLSLLHLRCMSLMSSVNIESTKNTSSSSESGTELKLQIRLVQHVVSRSSWWQVGKTEKQHPPSSGYPKCFQVAGFSELITHG